MRLCDRLQLHQIKGVSLTQSLLLFILKPMNVKGEFTHIETGNNLCMAKVKLALLIPIFHFEFCLKNTLKAVNKLLLSIWIATSNQLMSLFK